MFLHQFELSSDGPIILEVLGNDAEEPIDQLKDLSDGD